MNISVKNKILLLFLGFLNLIIFENKNNFNYEIQFNKNDLKNLKELEIIDIKKENKNANIFFGKNINEKNFKFIFKFKLQRLDLKEFYKNFFTKDYNYNSIKEYYDIESKIKNDFKKIFFYIKNRLFSNLIFVKDFSIILNSKKEFLIVFNIFDCRKSPEKYHNYIIKNRNLFDLLIENDSFYYKFISKIDDKLKKINFLLNKFKLNEQLYFYNFVKDPFCFLNNKDNKIKYI